MGTEPARALRTTGSTEDTQPLLGGQLGVASRKSSPRNLRKAKASPAVALPRPLSTGLAARWPQGPGRSLGG